MSTGKYFITDSGTAVVVAVTTTHFLQTLPFSCNQLRPGILAETRPADWVTV